MFSLRFVAICATIMVSPGVALYALYLVFAGYNTASCHLRGGTLTEGVIYTMTEPNKVEEYEGIICTK